MHFFGWQACKHARCFFLHGQPLVAHLVVQEQNGLSMSDCCVVNCHYQELISILISCCGHIAHVFISAVNCQLSLCLSLVSVL